MEEQRDRETPIAPWGSGGPKSAEHKALAKQWFLEALPRCHNVTGACDYASIGHATVYRWKEQDKKFSEAWDAAVERTHDIARQSIFQRGILGWDEPVVAQGRVALDENDERLTVHKWSDSLAALYVRANLPEYKEKHQIDMKLQMAEQDARDKEELLAGLAAAIANENKEPTS
ncbi:MAG TPA: hypothetical protein VFN23_04155 [Ktedonobacteraceae bacterium]|nr:hypothetical protein [Ktedonobacteraceae bacterium]